MSCLSYCVCFNVSMVQPYVPDTHTRTLTRTSMSTLNLDEVKGQLANEQMASLSARLHNRIWFPTSVSVESGPQPLENVTAGNNRAAINLQSRCESIHQNCLCRDVFVNSRGHTVSVGPQIGDGCSFVVFCCIFLFN